MNPKLQSSLSELTDIQRQAVDWNKGALIVLAGPGSGKTRVLTCRIARLLDESRDKRFRVLALTFTNKAADEMSDRVNSFVPELTDRVNIFTFHSFCSKMLRQHGVHLGIKPNFRIYSRREDRRALLHSAIGRDDELAKYGTNFFLPQIDRLKQKLIGVDECKSVKITPILLKAYRLYEDELHRANALDFHSLILQAYKLFDYPVFVKHYQSVYRYWLVDEFQDTNDAQYKLLQRMASNNFQEVFAVADDDQTIYEWNGASINRINSMVSDFSCNIIQLPTNFRCPPPIVEAANCLMVFNTQRLANKRQAISSQTDQFNGVGAIEIRVFSSDHEEIEGITKEISNLNELERSHTAVLARNRTLLQSIHESFMAKGVPSALQLRRDDFISPKMRWMISCLRQIDRPLDFHNLATLMNTFEHITPTSLNIEDIISISESESVSYLSTWINLVKNSQLPSQTTNALEILLELSNGSFKLNSAINKVIKLFQSETDDMDLQEDLSSWFNLPHSANHEINHSSLAQFLQELDLRSKIPSPQPESVSLATIHGAKGQEFDIVYLIGLVEEILPSWHSIHKNNGGNALEEERRACFVAITRTKKRLILSRAEKYKDCVKSPSRFLMEMGISVNERPVRQDSQELKV